MDDLNKSLDKLKNSLDSYNKNMQESFDKTEKTMKSIIDKLDDMLKDNKDYFNKAKLEKRKETIEKILKNEK